jgi:hypothetical protein
VAPGASAYSEIGGANLTSYSFVTSVSIFVGVWYFALNVTDATGAVVTSNVVSVTVNLVPTVSVSPGSWVMDVDQSEVFTATASGGTGSLSIQWYLNGQAVATGATCNFSAQSVGSDSIYVTVTDSASTPYTATSNAASITVNSAPVASVSPSSVVLDAGQSQLFASGVSGGTSSFAYRWCLNGTTVPDATNSTWTFTPSSSGFYTVYVNVTDNVGFRVKSNVALVTVSPARYLLLTAEPDEATYVGGSMVTFAVDVLNQLCPGLASSLTLTVTGPNGYCYFDSQSINVTANSVQEYSFTWNTPNAAGTYVIEVSLIPAQLTAYDAMWLLDNTPVSTHGVSTPITTFSFLALWLTTASLLATAVLQKGNFMRKKRKWKIQARAQQSPSLPN